MQDFLLDRAAKKKWIQGVCKQVFESYGFGPLETPTVENFELLAKKGTGGEAIKEEIYYFKDNSDRELGLRFDLTVPLARVVASNPNLTLPFKRYAIGRVYRYDRPQAKRYREFTQADWDILGSPSLLADYEILAIAIEVMKKLGFKENEFKIKINDRRLLEEVAIGCKVAKNKIVDCFRSLDKIDKIGKEEVEKELKKKGISTQILGQLNAKGLVKLKIKNPLAPLVQLLKANDLAKFVEVDLSLARGLEYYTGTVFEVAVKDSPSVGGGGRYDKLVESYGGKPTPAVGCSFGIERLLDSLEERIAIASPVKILFIPLGDKAVEEALGISAKIRALGTGCELDLMNRGIGKNIQYADKKGIPFVTILGDNELKEKALTLKNLKTGKQQKVKFADLNKLEKIVGE